MIMLPVLNFLCSANCMLGTLYEEGSSVSAVDAVYLIDSIMERIE